ncbi:TPA: hypothetical protein PPU89_002271 [Staphylococcus aureus]|uniref:hypothetical protein n=1 Tax=Staphylococcus chromogenes TaxID=46126 RepID=UPI001F218E5F|nr:hypothetical protein [Staphylococcus chromogenes]MCE4962632.1 hypothetical protein [Staphylococcus chromogenes]HDJ2072621.1 hypothetical protein [Staphylococcus aureus]
MSKLNMYEKLFVLIFSRSVTGYDIAKHSDISETTISQIRGGYRLIENLTIKKGLSLEKCYDEFEEIGKIEYQRDYKKASNYYEKMKMKKDTITQE